MSLRKHYAYLLFSSQLWNISVDDSSDIDSVCPCRRHNHGWNGMHTIDFFARCVERILCNHHSWTRRNAFRWHDRHKSSTSSVSGRFAMNYCLRQCCYYCYWAIDLWHYFVRWLQLEPLKRLYLSSKEINWNILIILLPASFLLTDIVNVYIIGIRYVSWCGCVWFSWRVYLSWQKTEHKMFSWYVKTQTSHSEADQVFVFVSFFPRLFINKFSLINTQLECYR